MCLNKVDPKPLRKFGIGYKIVEKLPNGSYTCYDHEPHAGTVDYPLNQWITDPNDGNADTPFSSVVYRTGFHISLDKKAMLELGGLLIKVRFRKVVATNLKGDHIYGRQVVARELINLGEVTK